MWDEYCRLRKEVKEAGSSVYGMRWLRKSMQTFGLLSVGEQKVSTNFIEEQSWSSTQGKLEVLRRHCEELGKVSVDDNFETDWKEEVVSTLQTCSNLSEVSENDRLDRQLDREEIAQCVNVKITRRGGGGGGGGGGV